MPGVNIIGLTGMPEVKPGDDLAQLLMEASLRQGTKIEDKDIIVVTHKVVSKAEGRLVELDQVAPSRIAHSVSKLLKKDPRLVEVILSEAKGVVRMAGGLIIAETKHGFICANAGVDQSNLPKGQVSLLPINPDRSARKIRERIREGLGVDVAVIITDTFGRPWRIGQVNFAIGVAGIDPIIDYHGSKDPFGYILTATQMAVADEIASAAELVMRKLSRIPAVIVRGVDYDMAEASIKKLIRRPSQDLFR